VLKEKPSNSGAGAGKKKGRPNKDAVSNATDVSSASKPGSGLMSFGFLSSILSAIYRYDQIDYFKC